MDAMEAKLLTHAVCNSVELDEFKQNHGFIERTFWRAGLGKDTAYPSYA